MKSSIAKIKCTPILQVRDHLNPIIHFIKNNRMFLVIKNNHDKSYSRLNNFRNQHAFNNFSISIFEKDNRTDGIFIYFKFNDNMSDSRINIKVLRNREIFYSHILIVQEANQMFIKFFKQMEYDKKNKTNNFIDLAFDLFIPTETKKLFDDFLIKSNEYTENKIKEKRKEIDKFTFEYEAKTKHLDKLEAIIVKKPDDINLHYKKLDLMDDILILKRKISTIENNIKNNLYGLSWYKFYMKSPLSM